MIPHWFFLRETPDKIVIFGEGNNRFEMPKSEIYYVGMNVILKIDFSDIFKYNINKNNPLPTAGNIEVVNRSIFRGLS